MTGNPLAMSGSVLIPVVGPDMPPIEVWEILQPAVANYN